MCSRFDTSSDPANQHLLPARGIAQEDDYNSQQMVVPFNLTFLEQFQKEDVAVDITAKVPQQHISCLPRHCHHTETEQTSAQQPSVAHE